MSPILFNTIMDGLLKQLPEEIGVNIGTMKVNALAFADDLILCASTPEGLQRLVDMSTDYLASCGLMANSAKCLSVNIKAQPKQKYTVIAHKAFNVNGREVPSLKRTQKFKYLGIMFSPDGKAKIEQHQDLIMKFIEGTSKTSAEVIRSERGSDSTNVSPAGAR